MTTSYRVTKKHTAGLLAGLTTTEVTSVRFEVGRTYKACIGSGEYIVVACEAVRS